MLSASHVLTSLQKAGEMRRKDNIEAEVFDAQYQNLAFSISPGNSLRKELDAIDQLLDGMPEILDLVHSDLRHNSKEATGRPTEVTCEQVIRTAILMQLRSLPYRRLVEELEVNPLYRKFTRFYGRKIPHFTTLNNLVKSISDQTMQALVDRTVLLARDEKVEDGKAIRHDTTVSETDIAHPLDSRLLNDSVRVMSRILGRLRQAAPRLSFPYHDHSRATKKRAYQIAMGKGRNIEKHRVEWYTVLLRYQEKVRGYAQGALDAFSADEALAQNLEIAALVAQLKEILPLADQVYDQAYRRVILGESVPADEKIVSIFETHTDIICRGKKGSATEFGHKFDVATGRSGIVTQYVVYKGNPCDGDVLKGAIENHKRLFGQAPERLAADRRYHSAANEQMANEAGVKQVAIPKPGRLSEMRKSLQKARWFRRLMRFRAGVEGNLSTLLRSFGLKRCLWQGWESFKAYVGLSVLTYNLRLLAGHVSRA